MDYIPFYKRACSVLKAPLILAIIFGSIFFACFYYLMYPKWMDPLWMSLLMFIVVFYGFGFRQVLTSYRFLKGVENRVGYAYKDCLTHPKDMWFVVQHGPFITILNKEDIRYFTTIETINRGKKDMVLVYQVTYVDYAGNKHSFYMNQTKEEKLRLMQWFDEKEVES